MVLPQYFQVPGMEAIPEHLSLRDTELLFQWRLLTGPSDCMMALTALENTEGPCIPLIRDQLQKPRVEPKQPDPEHPFRVTADDVRRSIDLAHRSFVSARRLGKLLLGNERAVSETDLWPVEEVLPRRPSEAQVTLVTGLREVAETQSVSPAALLDLTTTEKVEFFAKVEYLAWERRITATQWCAWFSLSRVREGGWSKESQAVINTVYPGVKRPLREALAEHGIYGRAAEVMTVLSNLVVDVADRFSWMREPDTPGGRSARRDIVNTGTLLRLAMPKWTELGDQVDALSVHLKRNQRVEAEASEGLVRKIAARHDELLVSCGLDPGVVDEVEIEVADPASSIEGLRADYTEELMGLVERVRRRIWQGEEPDAVSAELGASLKKERLLFNGAARQLQSLSWLDEDAPSKLPEHRALDRLVGHVLAFWPAVEEQITTSLTGGKSVPANIPPHLAQLKQCFETAVAESKA